MKSGSLGSICDMQFPWSAVT